MDQFTESQFTDMMKNMKITPDEVQRMTKEIVSKSIAILIKFEKKKVFH